MFILEWVDHEIASGKEVKGGDEAR